MCDQDYAVFHINISGDGLRNFFKFIDNQTDSYPLTSEFKIFCLEDENLRIENEESGESLGKSLK